MHEEFPISPERRNRQQAVAELRRYLKMPAVPVPHDALLKLLEAAQQDTGGGQACRYFLFWLAGQPDPTGYAGDGGLELRRLDGTLRSAALEVLTWWAGPTQSDSPLREILVQLRDQFGDRADSQFKG